MVNPQLPRTLQILEGLTAAQHVEIIEWAKNLMWTYPGDKLTKHCYLPEEDFEMIGEGLAGISLHWIASMESTQKAADQIHSGGQCMGGPGSLLMPARNSNRIKLNKDGSIVY